jgi:hypothetical protein
MEGALTNKNQAKMVITVLEAQVSSEKTALLEKVFNQAIKQLDAGIVQTFLTRNSKDLPCGRSSPFGKAAKPWMRCANRVRHPGAF